MDVNNATLGIIKRNEGCELKTYKDSVGVLTIGYGHTGPDVKTEQIITQDRAEELLREDVERFKVGVELLVATTPTTNNQFGAMISLAYNVGLGAFKRSTVYHAHHTGNYAAAADAFLLWDRAGGRVLTGLVRRRHEERMLYLTPDEA